MNWAQLAELDPKHRWELLNGVPYAMSGASSLHQATVLELTLELGPLFRNGPCRLSLAPFDVRLSEHDVVQPDLLVSCGDKWRSNHHEGPPDLVVEVVSPGSFRHDRVRKMDLYTRFGVTEYWLVTPRPLVVELFNWEGGKLTHRSFDDSSSLRSIRFPEVVIDLAALNERLPPGRSEEEVREELPAYHA